VTLSYSWVKGLLQGAGPVAKGRRRGAHRKRRPWNFQQPQKQPQSFSGRDVTNHKLLKKLVSAEGIESALKRTFNNMQSNGRQF
jgi:hypothetical protein